MTPIRNRSDLAEALAQPRAFLFLWVNWANQAFQSRSIVIQAIASYQTEHPDSSVPCYVADVSDQSGEVWDALAEWLTAEGRPVSELMWSGVGPLLWIRSGHVILHVLAPHQLGAVKLVAASQNVFADAA